MKLTKSQRHTAYIIMLAEWEAGCNCHAGFCYLATETFCNDFEEDPQFNSYANFYKLWPELYSKVKKSGAIFYFDNWDQRIKALNQCIIETYTP